MRDINLYAQDYTSSEFEWILSKYRVKKVLEVMEKYKHDRFLEVGCAMWPLALYEKEYKHYTLVEASDKYMRNAQQSIGINENITYCKEFFEKAEEILKDDIYDYIVISGLLHEVENPEELIDTAINLGNNDTVYYMSVSNAKSFHRLLALESGIVDSVFSFSEKNIQLQQHAMFDMEGFYNLINDVVKRKNKKLKVREKGSYYIKPFTHKQMEACLHANIINNNIINGLDGMIKYMPDMGAEIYIVFSVV